ncbi:LCP family protein [Candidatus Berkelbacteria bacterium]|nr:LCP family protein [Candidatus Berkelbacteria bacterium]
MVHNDLPEEPISSSRLDNLVNPQRIWLKRSILMIGLLLVGALIFYVLSATSNLSKIIVQNTGRKSPILAGIRNHGLQGEGDGRINILLLGIGGANHPGGLLTDTIMLLSIDPVNHKAAFITIPRDLAVTYPKPLTGAGKINNVHAYGEEQKSKIPGGGPQLMKQAVADVFDIPVHYFIRIDFQAFQKLVDAVGGVTITVDKPLYDPLYPAPNMVDYEPFSLSAGVQTLDGKTALKYARSRETTSDFDRSRRQIQILEALKQKAFTFGILSNPRKINDIARILGDRVRTDLSVSEIEQLVGIVTQIKEKPIAKIFDTGEGSPLTSTQGENGAYLVVPKSGNFAEIQRIAHQIFTDPYLALEKATIEVRNGSGSPEISTELEAQLKSYGYQVVKIADAKDVVSQTTIYDFTRGNKSYTIDFLKKRLNAAVVADPNNTVKRTSNADILVHIGADYGNRKTTIKLGN